MATALSPTYGHGSVLGFDLVRERDAISSADVVRIDCPVAEFNAQRSGKSDGSIIGNDVGLHSVQPFGAQSHGLYP